MMKSSKYEKRNSKQYLNSNVPKLKQFRIYDLLISACLGFRASILEFKVTGGGV